MALVKVDFFSESLMRTVSIQALIPVDKIEVGKERTKEKRHIKHYIYYMVFLEIIQIGYVEHEFKDGHKIMTLL